MKKTTALFVALAVLITVFSACICGCKKQEPNGSSSEIVIDGSAKQGGFVSGYIVKPDTLNPLFTKIAANREALSVVYDSLFIHDKSYNLAMQLAYGYSFSENCKKLSVKLRDGICWHDGSAFTASDVVYTVNTILSEETSYYHPAISSLISSVYVGSDNSVVFDLEYADSGAAELLTFPILKKGTGGVSSASDYIPLGTGAFAVEKYEPEAVLKLVRNDKWPLGHVYVDGANLNVLPTEDTAFSAFESGMIDYIKVDYANAGKFAVSDGVNFEKLCTRNYTFVGINTENAVLKNSGVRKLLYYLVADNEALASLFGNYSASTVLPVSPEYSFSAEPERFASFDEAMQSTGCRKNDDGKLIFRDEEGNEYRLRFSLLVNEENSRRVLIAENLSALFSDSGIDVDLVKTDYENYLKRIADGEFDLYVGESILSCDNNLYPYYGSCGKSNFGKFADGDTDALLDALTENAENRDKNLEAVLKDFTEKVPHLPICFEVKTLVYNSKKIDRIHTFADENYCHFLTECTTK